MCICAYVHVHTPSEVIGVTRNDGIVIKQERLEQVLRLELDATAARAFAIQKPLKVTITNYDGPATHTIELEAPVHPKRPELGTRKLPFGKVVYIEASDFREQDEKGYFGLAPGKEVRLLHAFNIKCESAVKDDEGNVIELLCTYDSDKSAKLPKGKRFFCGILFLISLLATHFCALACFVSVGVGKLHWVESGSALKCSMNLYDLLFTVEEPMAHDNWLELLNPDSLIVETGALVEPSVGAFADKTLTSFQFQRLGYFTVDSESKKGAMVFNRAVGLKQSNATKAAKK